MQQPLSISLNVFFYKNVLDFYRHSKILCQTSLGVKITVQFYPHEYLAGFLPERSWINTRVKWRYTLLQTNTIISNPPQDPLSNGVGDAGAG